MILYLLIVTLVYFVYQNRGEKRVVSVLLFFVILFLCGGYMCGSDWRQYELIFNSNVSIREISFEPGIYALMLIFRKIWDNYWFFSIVIKVACFWSIWKLIQKYAKEHALLALVFFISFYGIYLFVDAPLRNLLAIGVFMCSCLLLDRNKLLSYGVCLSALFFHASAIICLPLLLIIDKKVPSWLFLVAYLFSLVLSFFPDFLRTVLVDSYVGNLLFIGDKVTHYFEYGFAAESLISSSFSLGEVLKIILFFFVFFNGKRIKSFDYGTIIFNGCMIFFIVAKLGAAINVLMRLGCFFSPFYAIAIGVIIKCFAARDKLFYSFGVFLLSLLLTYKTVSADYRFVPYTNYITYNIVHFGKNLSFYERSQYNFIHSPYADSPDK